MFNNSVHSSRKKKNMLENVKWPFLGYLVISLGLIALRNSRFKYSSQEFSSAKAYCDEIINRTVDISDSRLSNFDSDSSDRELTSSELLAIDRVFPLTKTLNKLTDKICRKFSLLVTLEDKKMLSLEKETLNLTYFEDENDNNTERKLFGKNAFISRLDSLKRLGNAYIAEDTDTRIILVQKLQFQILKQSFDFYDENSGYLGGCSFIYNNNVFILSTELSTSYDNSDCTVKSVNFKYLSDKIPLKLRIEGLSGTEVFYEKLKTVLFNNFITRVTPLVEQELSPVLTKLIDQADVCSYFDANPNQDSSSNNLANQSSENFF